VRRIRRQYEVLQWGHRLRGYCQSGGEARLRVEVHDRDQAGGRRGPEAGPVALGDGLAASPGRMEGGEPLSGSGSADSLRGSRLERTPGEVEQVAPRPDSLDVDTDLATARDRDQRPAAAMAEIELQVGGGAGQGRLAVLAEAQLDRRRAGTQVAPENFPQRPARSRPIELSMPYVHFVREHEGEDT